MPKRRRQNKINKRRIVKKRIIKKQQQNTSTPEQNAKHNELLKMLLNRQQPTIPTANPEITKLNNEIRDLQDRNNKTLSIMEMKKQERENELVRKKEIADKEFELKHKQKIDKANQEHDKKMKQLKMLNSIYDGRTTLGRIKNEIKKAEDEIDSYKLKIKENEIYNNLVELEQENKILQTRIQADQEIINSDKFKNPEPSYIAELKKREELKLELEHNKRIKERQQQLLQDTAEYKAEKNVLDDYWNKPKTFNKFRIDPNTNLPALDENYNYRVETEIDKDGNKRTVKTEMTKAEHDLLMYQAHKQANYENEERMNKLINERKRLNNMNNERQQLQIDNISKQQELNMLEARNKILEENIKRELSEEERQKIKDTAKLKADIELQKQQLINNQELAEAEERSKYLKSLKEHYNTDEYKNSVAKLEQEKHLIRQKEQENINKERLYETIRRNIELQQENKIINNYAAGDYSDPNALLQLAQQNIDENHNKNKVLAIEITKRDRAINDAIKRFKKILEEDNEKIDGEKRFYEFFKAASEIKQFPSEPDYTQLNPEYYANLTAWIELIGGAPDEVIRNKNNEFASWIDTV